MSKPVLGEQDYIDAAKTIGCALSSVKAVAQVESAGAGFLASDFPKILFEGHIFCKYTRGIYSAEHPTISYPKWTKAFYLGGEREYERLNAAKALDVTAALMSTSWGKFQIMGFNFALCGYKSVGEFVAAMYLSEREHLLAFIEYVKHVGLDDELRDKRWAAFADKYNGPQYRKNNYDGRLAAADKKFGG